MIFMNWVLIFVIFGVQMFGVWGSGSNLDKKIKWYCPDNYESNGVPGKDSFRALVGTQFLLKL